MRILPDFLVFVFILFCACDVNKHNQAELVQENVLSDSNSVTLEFSLFVNQNEYELTNYGEAPQIAIWLENKDSNQVRTVWVSHRAGKNDWKGKVECPIALPYWNSRHHFEKSGFRERNFITRVIDAITGATPTGGKFTQEIIVPKNSCWDYFIEINVSGDYNVAFPYWSKDGMPDSEGNGQPSIVYKGKIIADGHSSSLPELIGRTDQRHPVDKLITDLTGLTTAKNLLSEISVVSKFFYK
jgi:hypothetical protein